MCQSCNRDNEVALLRTALANLLEVTLAVDDATYLDACRQIGIYHSRLVAQKALNVINQ